MPRLVRKVPAYRKHHSAQAIVVLNHKTHYLGKYGPKSGYAETNMAGYRSSTLTKVYDADGDNVYGTEGLFFFDISDENTTSGFPYHTQVGADGLFPLLKLANATYMCYKREVCSKAHLKKSFCNRS